ncbi:MAG: TonB-dependent receptor plug domain-containing protein [Sphingobacteriales bacterium JAD_PAG50586_3]|nr:MAG: TonB-dependent receptor plug domain-containing protein [Sphingobacteriales bacterium JAD_PAG50586_3]
MKKVLLFMVFLLVMSTGVIAQPIPSDTTAQAEDDVLSLEDLMKVKITVASRNEQTMRETPAVVTIVTGEEIRNSGARDLIDILRLVPGFDFAEDVEGVVGMGIRGIWAQEAKVLLQIDGIDMMETSYGSLQFVGHYPVTNIERIEIIRGPGSVIYGGNASLAVINIITRDGKKINGIGANITYGQMDKALARRTVNIGGGKEFSNGINFKVNVMLGQLNMSDRTINNPTYGLVNYADSSGISTGHVNAAFKYKGLEASYIYDSYNLQSTLISNNYLFRAHMANVKYTYKVSDKFSIIPRLTYKQQLPWFLTDKTDTASYNTNISTYRYTAAVQLNYKPIDKLELTAGGEFFADHAKVYSNESHYRFTNGDNKIAYTNYTGYLQGQYTSKWANFTAGVRLDKHNRFGYVVLPRAAVTKVFGRFHAKLMYSWAYRAPVISNLDVNPDIKPEMVTVSEAEVGMQITDKMYVTVNVFDNKVTNPIVYTLLNDVENYVNDDRSGTRGGEFEFRLKSKGGYFNLNYSYYHKHINKG